MRFLDEHRRRPALLADHLPWAAMVAPGVVLNKDGSFTCGLRFRGPDLESASDLELMSVRARLNNALKRLGSGWCLHVEARRRAAQPYPVSAFEIAAAWLVDAERRALFETSEPAFETDYRAALTWLPPADQTRPDQQQRGCGRTRPGHHRPGPSPAAGPQPGRRPRAPEALRWPGPPAPPRDPDRLAGWSDTRSGELRRPDRGPGPRGGPAWPGRTSLRSWQGRRPGPPPRRGRWNI